MGYSGCTGVPTQLPAHRPLCQSKQTGHGRGLLHYLRDKSMSSTGRDGQAILTLDESCIRCPGNDVQKYASTYANSIFHILYPLHIHRTHHNPVQPCEQTLSTFSTNGCWVGHFWFPLHKWCVDSAHAMLANRGSSSAG